MHQALYGLRKAGGVWVRVAGGRRGARTIMMPQRNMSAESINKPPDIPGELYLLGVREFCLDYLAKWGLLACMRESR